MSENLLKPNVWMIWFKFLSDGFRPKATGTPDIKDPDLQELVAEYKEAD